MRYDLNSDGQAAAILLDGLAFANGVALSKDSDFLLIVETTTGRILRYWLETARAGNVEVFAQLPGFADNIKRSPRGGYWVGMYTRRSRLVGWILSHPGIGRVLLKLPLDVMRIHAAYSRWTGRGTAVRLSEDGEVVETLDEEVGRRWGSISEVQERDNGVLWIGSVTMPFAGAYNL